MGDYSTNQKDVALITRDVEEGGGVPSMTYFLYQVLRQSESYKPEIISLATSSRDRCSVRLLEPNTWFRSPQIEERTFRDVECVHVGAWFTEFEIMRYRPRKILDGVLSKFDLLQFSTGTSPWAFTAFNMEQPVFLWTATTLWEDRQSRLTNGSGLKNWGRRVMTRWVQSYERQALQEANTVFALSDYTRESLKNQFSIDSVLATCGVDTDQFQPVEHPKEEYILTVSRINDPRKRVPLLLEAYATAKHACDDIPALYIVGDAPNDRIQRAVHKYGLSKDVRFFGKIPHSELVKLYQHALCFVLSSDEEGLGIVILEAMACGRPVLSTSCGGPETLVVDEETGLLTPVGDADALQQGIKRLVRDQKLRNRMGAASRQRVVENFSFDVAKRTFLRVYDAH